MKAIKANKVYIISEVEKAGYIDQGFDIQDDDGGVVAYGRGKTVPYKDHAAAVKEIERLQVMLSERKEPGTPADDEGVLDILKIFASEHGIDLGKTATIGGMVKKIKEKMQELPKEGE